MWLPVCDAIIVIFVVMAGASLTPVPPGRCVPTTYMIATLTGTSTTFKPTTANVFLQLEGEWGKGGVLCLQTPTNHQITLVPFSRSGQCDVFEFKSLGSVGDIKSVHIWHDNSGPAPDLLLDKVEVHDSNAGYIYRFLCSSVLSNYVEGTKASLRLPCVGKKIQRLPPAMSSTKPIFDT